MNPSLEVKSPLSDPSPSLSPNDSHKKETIQSRIASLFARIFSFVSSREQACQATGSIEQTVALLDQLIAAQNAHHVITEGDTLGRRAFGNLWSGIESDWSALRSILTWQAECDEKSLFPLVRRVMDKIGSSEDFSDLVSNISGDLKPFFKQLQQLFGLLRYEIATGFGIKDLHSVSLTAVRDRLQAWRQSVPEVLYWSTYCARCQDAKKKGLESIVRALHDGGDPAQIPAQFEIGFYESLLRKVYEQHPDLARFKGENHEEVMKRFRELDLERIQLARQQAALAHFHNLPTAQTSSGELGTLLHEIKKKKRHKPIRKLLADAGHAIQQIKPVFMMSPISVAQYLEPGIIEFDVLLIDEASQVRPVDALGAVARCRQIIVVGDECQMPPTNFFNKMFGGDEEPDDDEQEVSDLESVLGLCLARNIPQRMLRWHYRSRHHSLIAVSNHEFYNDRLFVIPNPIDRSQRMGLAFHHIANGYFDRGKTRTNPVEARAVAQAVIEHAREHSQKTLGVGTFSVAQRDAIEDELELLRRSHPELETFFATGTEEPFFVKNLENIQGDERDVIFISVGYAQDKDGYSFMSFGPLQNDGGERRLNVLISRAKERCEVFSSITSDYIDTRRAKSRGAIALKTFLSYAQTGNLDIPKITGGEFDSEFEKQVAYALNRHGYELESQVGVAGFFIDLGVVDPDIPGRYVLGIECDGAQYHSSRSARDRDRLRQQVLEDRDWIIHRIWSTDWFNDPEGELRKTLQAIGAAKLEWQRRQTVCDVEENKPPESSSSPGIERHEPTSVESDRAIPIQTVPYKIAEVTLPTPHELIKSPTMDIARVVLEIVSAEGPIHMDEVIRRTATTWGLNRAGSRIKQVVSTAIEYCESEGMIAVTDECWLDMSGKRGPVAIRDRSSVDSVELRKPEYLPSAEIEVAIRAIVAVCIGIELEPLAVELSRVFGFKSTGRKLKEVFVECVHRLCAQGLLDERQGKLYLHDNDNT